MRSDKRKEGQVTQKERRIIVRPIPRKEIDLQRLARCIIELAIEQQQRIKEAETVDQDGQSDRDAA